MKSSPINTGRTAGAHGLRGGPAARVARRPARRVGRDRPLAQPAGAPPIGRPAGVPTGCTSSSQPRHLTLRSHGTFRFTSPSRSQHLPFHLTLPLAHLLNFKIN